MQFLLLLNIGKTAVYFEADGRVTVVEMKVKISVNERIKISEKQLSMDDGISSKLTQFEGLRSFTGPLN
jgi:hypothetical protein